MRGAGKSRLNVPTERTRRFVAEFFSCRQPHGVGFKVLTEHGASIDTISAGGKLVFGIFAALAEFERELIIERTKAGMAAARARGRKGGRPYTMTTAKLRLAMAAMESRDTKVGDLCPELGITRQTLYRHVDPKGNLPRSYWVAASQPL